MNNYNVKIIDVHTHVFPDKLADRASHNIGAYYSIKMSCNGSIASLLDNAKDFTNIRFVISSAALKEENVRHGNDFLLAAAEADKRFIPLGSVYPYMPTSEAIKQLVYIKEHGAKGIKLHPDFQRFEIDMESMTDVYKACAELKLPILFHVGDENSDASSPKRLYNVMNKVPDLVAISAHMGGYQAWDEAEEILYGTNVYMDTSDALLCLPPERVMRQIERQGADKIMFGSDYPLRSTKEAFDLFQILPLTDEQKEQIYYKTAEKVFDL
ncbi:MAG: amidohydrolase [Clostridia bacterium]|nr:amidohydrolase [Clostridia bacterium]